jgi:hypothetical protein
MIPVVPKLSKVFSLQKFYKVGENTAGWKFYHEFFRSCTVVVLFSSVLCFPYSPNYMRKIKIYRWDKR